MGKRRRKRLKEGAMMGEKFLEREKIWAERDGWWWWSSWWVVVFNREERERRERWVFGERERVCTVGFRSVWVY
ncbi:hypothetical protein HanIR_Chr12g0584531 [Helianthus annuus]|nr:hypothetical protein HanIR_Chr12g0584531 [Helianthus annuus]